MALVFFFNDTATTEIYTLSLHDALPISRGDGRDLARARRRLGRHLRGPGLPASRAGDRAPGRPAGLPRDVPVRRAGRRAARRSEEHTSELQSRQYLVCRLLLEKKNNRSM